MMSTEERIMDSTQQDEICSLSAQDREDTPMVRRA